MPQRRDPIQKPDGKRGNSKTDGWWINIEEAKQRSKHPSSTKTQGQEEWWKMLTLDGEVVEVCQYDSDGPESKPVWLYECGDMYLGEWQYNSQYQSKVEHGVGIYYSHAGPCKGLVSISEWRNGWLHGRGKSLHMPCSNVWKDNYLPGSPVCAGRKKYPFAYEGGFRHSLKHGFGTVTLKDGTTRYGEWSEGEPVGDWWKDHDVRLPTRRSRKARRTTGRRSATTPATIQRVAEIIDLTTSDLEPEVNKLATGAATSSSFATSATATAPTRHFSRTPVSNRVDRATDRGTRKRPATLSSPPVTNRKKIRNMFPPHAISPSSVKREPQESSNSEPEVEEPATAVSSASTAAAAVDPATTAAAPLPEPSAVASATATPEAAPQSFMTMLPPPTQQPGQGIPPWLFEMARADLPEGVPLTKIFVMETVETLFFGRAMEGPLSPRLQRLRTEFDRHWV